jgi:hypothetical protein
MNSDPEPRSSSHRPSTWIIIAAVVATAALIAGLVAIFSQEGDRLLNGTPAAPADDRSEGQRAEAAAAPSATPAPETLPATEGTVSATCTLDAGVPNAQTQRVEHVQRCDVDDGGVQPFAVPQTIALSVVTAGAANDSARSFVSADGSGYVTAGYVLGSDSEYWFVGGAPGVGSFAGLPIHFAGRSGADGAVVYDWYLTDGLPPASNVASDGETTEVTFTCERTADPDADGTTTNAGAETGTGDEGTGDVAAPVRQSCTYEGDDPRFIPLSNDDPAVVTASGGGAGRFGSTRFFAAAYESGTIRTGLIDDVGVLRFAGLAEGAGELSGTLVHEIGWGAMGADGSATGTIRMTALPG